MKKNRRFMSHAVIALVMAAFVAGPAGSAVAFAQTEVVAPDNLGVDWFDVPPAADTRPPGFGEFVNGPDVPPLGVGSYCIETVGGVSKVQLTNYDYIGVPLADIDALSYWTYRDGSSTSAAWLVPSINVVIDFNGAAAGGFATLVWEPNVPGGPGAAAVLQDTWQMWDAYAGGAAIWWSTRAFPGVPQAFNSFVPWSQIVANNPDAVVLGFIGINAGSGWANTTVACVDALTVGVAGDSITYDFELYRDSDGDGIPDDFDECPYSDLSPTIVIDGCDSGVPNILFDDGCTMIDLILELADGAKNHGQFVSAVSKLTNTWKKAGLISGAQKGAIQSCVAQSSLP